MVNPSPVRSRTFAPTNDMPPAPMGIIGIPTGIIGAPMGIIRAPIGPGDGAPIGGGCGGEGAPMGDCGGEGAPMGGGQGACCSTHKGVVGAWTKHFSGPSHST